MKMASHKKAQAAMEFLMTYGWAILVVLGAIGALAYFGVLSPDKFLPEKCMMSPGVTCTGFKVTSTGFALVLTNNFGKDIFIESVQVGSCAASLNESLKNSKTTTVSYASCNFSSAGDRFDADISVTYTEKISGLTKSVTGTLNSKIQPGSELGGREETGGLNPVTLTPSLAESYQDEGTTDVAVTSVVAAVDDNWAPTMTGSVSRPYYATGGSPAYFDALAVQFSVSEYDSALYDGTLRFYLRDGPYSGNWRHYKIYDAYKDNSECYDVAPPCGGSLSFANNFEGWIEVSLEDSYWDDGDLSIRLWDAYIDKVELYLVPQ